MELLLVRSDQFLGICGCVQTDGWVPAMVDTVP